MTDGDARELALRRWQDGNPDVRKYSEFYTSFLDGYDIGRASVHTDGTER